MTSCFVIQTLEISSVRLSQATVYPSVRIRSRSVFFWAVVWLDEIFVIYVNYCFDWCFILSLINWRFAHSKWSVWKYFTPSLKHSEKVSEIYPPSSFFKVIKLWNQFALHGWICVQFSQRNLWKTKARLRPNEIIGYKPRKMKDASLYKRNAISNSWISYDD